MMSGAMYRLQSLTASVEIDDTWGTIRNNIICSIYK